MADKLHLWSRDPIENSEDPPLGAPENFTTIDSLNNIMREMMATTRSFYENPTWRDYGLTIDLPVTNDHTFQVSSGNFTGLYFPGQRLQFEDTTTKYGTVLTVDEGATLTVVCVMDGTSVLVAPTIVRAGLNFANATLQSSDGDIIVGDGVGGMKTSGAVIESVMDDSTGNVPTSAAIKDYLRVDQGTSTPRLYTTAHDGSNVNYSKRQASWYTIGDMVYVTVDIRLTSSGNLSLTSDALLMDFSSPALPEAYDNNINGQTVGMLYEYKFNTGTGSGVPDGGVCAWIDSGDAFMGFKQPNRTAGGTMLNVNGNTLSSDSTIRFSGAYRRAPL